MEYLDSLEELTERIESVIGADCITHLDVTDEPDALAAGPLGELADSENGGVLMVLGVGVDAEGNCALDRLVALFPIIQTQTSEVDEGWVWAAVVAGTKGVPRNCGDASTVQRMAELAPLMDAGLEELDLSPLGVKKGRFNGTEADELLEAVLSDEQCIWDKGIATIRDGRVVCTVAGMIALGRHPHRFLPGLCVELDLYGERFCWRGGSVRELVARASEVSWPCLLPGKNKFRQLFVNAIVHRGWRRCDWKHSIQVTVSEGTLEIVNPGCLGEWRVGKSTPVNPKLFALFCELELASAKGVGLFMVDRYLIKKQFRQFELEERGGRVHFEVPWPYPPESPPKSPEPARPPAASTQAASPVSHRPPGGSASLPSHNAQGGHRMERPVERSRRNDEQVVEPFDDWEAGVGSRSSGRGQAGPSAACGGGRVPAGQIGPTQIALHPEGLYRDSRYPEGQIGPTQITFNPEGFRRETQSPVRQAEPAPSRNSVPATSGLESRSMDHQAISPERRQDFSMDDFMDRLQREAGPDIELVRSRHRHPAVREPEARSVPASTIRAPSNGIPGMTSSQTTRPGAERSAVSTAALPVQRPVANPPGRSMAQASVTAQELPARVPPNAQPRSEAAPSVARTSPAVQSSSRVPSEHTSGAPKVAPVERAGTASSGRSVPEPAPPVGMAAFYARWLAIMHQPASHKVPTKWTIAEMIKFDSLREIIGQLAPGDPEHRNRVFGELLKRWKDCEVTVTGVGVLSGAWMLVDDGPRTKTGVPYKLVRVD